jgi:hypothetical protein
VSSNVECSKTICIHFLSVLKNTVDTPERHPGTNQSGVQWDRLRLPIGVVPVMKTIFVPVPPKAFLRCAGDNRMSEEILPVILFVSIGISKLILLRSYGFI